jgi:hypothetical protein
MGLLLVLISRRGGRDWDSDWGLGRNGRGRGQLLAWSIGVVHGGVFGSRAGIGKGSLSMEGGGGGRVGNGRVRGRRDL